MARMFHFLHVNTVHFILSDEAIFRLLSQGERMGEVSTAKKTSLFGLLRGDASIRGRLETAAELNLNIAIMLIVSLLSIVIVITAICCEFIGKTHYTSQLYTHF